MQMHRNIGEYLLYTKIFLMYKYIMCVFVGLNIGLYKMHGTHIKIFFWSYLTLYRLKIFIEI